MSTAIKFEAVSKRFRLHKDRPRTLQEKLLSLLQNRGSGEYQDFWALRDVSFEVARGETVGLVGPNGSGKSTALKLMARILEPTSGIITVNGQVSALLELGAGFHPDLTGRENVFLNGALLGLSRAETRAQFDDIVDFAELHDFVDMPVKHYSSGMYMRLGFSVAVHLQPEILLVDEILAVGDTAFQNKCMDRIADLRREGVTIVFVSHDLRAVQSLCNRVLWFSHGDLRADGDATDVVMAYLGRVGEDEEAAQRRQAGTVPDNRRWGNGPVRITAVELCDADGRPRSVFHTGDGLEIRLHYQAKERVPAPIFGLAIHHQNGTHVCGPNTKFGGCHIPHVEGEGVVSYRVPTLPLLQGTYELTVAVTNQEQTQTFDYHDRAYPFRVYPGGTQEQYGIVTLNGEWEVTESPLSGQFATETSLLG